MLAAVCMAIVLGQPGPACPSCGGPPHGSYPLAPLHPGFGGFWHILHGEMWGMSADKCPCTLGTFVPYGDPWAFQMHGGMLTPAPASAPATAPPPTTPAPAATVPPAAPAESGPSTNPPPPVNLPPLPDAN
jgi:hypothetical protein